MADKVLNIPGISLDSLPVSIQAVSDHVKFSTFRARCPVLESLPIEGDLVIRTEGAGFQSEVPSKDLQHLWLFRSLDFTIVCVCVGGGGGGRGALPIQGI